jgi:hypothetical protein
VKVRPSIAAVAAAALVGSGAFVFPALASSHAATHTIKFISVDKSTVSFNKTSIGVQDTAVNKAGKVVGYDETYAVAVSATTGDSEVAIDLAGGFLYGTYTYNFDTGKISNGKVIGGTGAFKGATGKFTAKAISSTKTAVTLTYST